MKPVRTSSTILLSSITYHHSPPPISLICYHFPHWKSLVPPPSSYHSYPEIHRPILLQRLNHNHNLRPLRYDSPHKRSSLPPLPNPHPNQQSNRLPHTHNPLPFPTTTNTKSTNPKESPPTITPATPPIQQSTIVPSSLSS